MAACLLRLGRLKWNSLGTLRRPPAAWFCIEAKEAANTVKKPKGPAKTGEDKRSAQLASKTGVAFPVKYISPGVLPPSRGETKEPIGSAATSEIIFGTEPELVALVPSSQSFQSHEEVPQNSVEAVSKESVPAEIHAPAVTIDIIKAAGVSNKLEDAAIEELLSSSSSESDTDSDSELEDEDKKLELGIETRNCSPELKPSHQEGGEDEVHKVTGVTKGITNAETKEAQSRVEVSKPISEDKGFEVLSASKSVAELTRSDILTNAAPSVTVADFEALVPVVGQNETPHKTNPNAHVPADGLGDAPKEFMETIICDPVKSEIVSTKVVASHPAEVGSSANRADELVDSVETQEAAGEELHGETSAEQPEEPASAPPEPEEPFDNSTYKNYQHHDYTSYTFADLDVEMAKYRLPQPSSGKPSPTH
ncbi:uncharacterized protein ndufv3 isoform X1 [Cyprinodon tularosa]|uniref:uncharacterized protein ndufv3 isoform X1 n=1 Tax=Cyprinodon tularosa TaxID=77115 RepID=UPI0018E1EFF5|nr:uncharacterized protein ndufv3 isoform X1 [Cyprinodon tularosa]